MRKVVAVLLVTAVLTALALTSAGAQLDLKLDSYTLSGSPGASFLLTGTLLNTGALPITVLETGCWTSGSCIDSNLEDYFLGYRGISLAPNESWSGAFVGVRIRPEAQIGRVGILSFWVDFGEPVNAVWGTTGEVECTVNVVPEPSGLMALACGVTGIGGMLLRRRRNR